MSEVVDRGGASSTSQSVVVRELVQTFDGRCVLDHVSLSVGRGELVTIGGPSGGGKSTLLHLIAALDSPTSGFIVVNGRDLSRHRHLDRYRRSEIGVVFQLHNLLPHLTVVQNVEIAALGTRVRSQERSNRARGLLDTLGLGHVADASPPRLSGGERQRVAIARALVNRPPVLLADEPTGSLDPVATRVVANLFRQMCDDQGTTVITVSHDPIVLADADRQLRLDDGHLREVEATSSGSPRETETIDSPPRDGREQVSPGRTVP